ncbi:MAG: hypothetical protein PHS14_03495 [Elusimicrobia bacterium]|nr:hypothetical protein [Elusimicrobiota bacterium]
MATARRILLIAGLLPFLPVVLHAESQPTSVSTLTFVLTLPPDPFSVWGVDGMVALPDGTRFVQGSGASNSAYAQFLLKVNPDGAPAWDPFAAGGRGLTMDAAGNSYVANTDFSDPSQPRVRVVKFNSAGGQAASADLAATNTTGGDGFPFAEGVAVDAIRGRVYVTYSFFSYVQLQNTFAVTALDTDLQVVSGPLIYDPGFTGSFLGPDPKGGTFVDGNGEVWVVGLWGAPGAPSLDLFAAHYGPNLVNAAVATFPSWSAEEVWATADPRGGLVVGGDRPIDFNLYLHRVTATGGFGAAFRFEGFADLSPMTVDPAGNLYILGYDPSSFLPAVAKVNASNTLAWDQPGPYLNLPGTFYPGAVAAANSTTFDVAGVSFDANPSPVVLLHYQSVANSTAAFAMSISTGNNQAGTVTKAARISLTVKVVDAVGAAAVGTAVTFSTSAAPSGAAGHGLSVISTTTAQDGTAATVLTFGDRVGTYTVTAACAGCAPSSAIFTAVAELRLVISLNPGSIRPLGTETSTEPARTTLLVTAAGISFPLDRVHGLSDCFDLDAGGVLGRT